MRRSLALTFSLCLIVAAQGLADEKPLKIYILVGQSNMQGHAQLKTLEHIGMDPKTKPMLNEIVDDSGTPKSVDDVWISYLSRGGEKTGQLKAGFGADDNKIGPELTFGIYIQKRLNEPVLLIKTAWGGKSINTDFRPPSAGPYQFNQKQIDQFKKQKKDLAEIKSKKAQATGAYYKMTLAHVKKVLGDIKRVYPDYKQEQGYELAGVVWFQGWNDMVDSGTYPNRGKEGGYDAYATVLGHLIRDLRRDLEAPELPFVVGVMGAGGPTKHYPQQKKRYLAVHQSFRDAMAATALQAEFKNNVVNVLTENCWDMELDAIVDRDAKIHQKIRGAERQEKLLELASEAKLEESELENVKAANKKRQLKQLIQKKLRETEFTNNEIKILETGKSNAEFHYLGCGKIMACIGKKFAEAMPISSKDAR